MKKNQKIASGLIFAVLLAGQITIFSATDKTVQIVAMIIMVLGLLGALYIALLNYSGRGKSALLWGLVIAVTIGILGVLGYMNLKNEHEEIKSQVQNETK